MSEKIKLYPIPEKHTNPTSGKTRDRKIHEVELTDFSDIPNSMGVEPKLLHKVRVKSGKIVSLVERGSGPISTEGYIQLWEAFKKAGIPVVKFIRKSKDGVFMKNLKHDGSEIFGSAYASLSEMKFSKGHPKLTPIEQRFVEIMESDLPKIRSALESMLKNAKEHRLVLPWDDPFELLVHPDGTWELIVLDLRFAEIGDNTWKNEKFVNGRLDTLINLKDFLVVKSTDTSFQTE